MTENKPVDMKKHELEHRDEALVIPFANFGL